MKAQIIKRIHTLQVEKATKNTQHNTLNQSDCLNEEGNQLRKRISYIDGQIAELFWILNRVNTSK